MLSKLNFLTSRENKHCSVTVNGRMLLCHQYRSYTVTGGRLFQGRKAPVGSSFGPHTGSRAGATAELKTRPQQHGREDRKASTSSKQSFQRWHLNGLILSAIMLFGNYQSLWYSTHSKKVADAFFLGKCYALLLYC